MATTAEDIPGLDESRCAHAPAVHTFDHRHAVIVRPTEIRPGDGMQDLGRLRRVEHVRVAGDTISPTTIVSVRFDDSADGPYASLSIHGNVDVVVWRVLDDG
jgi:hypothetical protein